MTAAEPAQGGDRAVRPSASKRALVIEGGGMRGAHSAGVLDAWWTAGVRFDAIYGTSAGACSAAFWAAGQPRFRQVWGDALHGGRLIRYRNALGSGAVFDLQRLIYRIFVQDYGLDVSAIRRSSSRLYISATRCRDGSAHLFDCHDPEVDILEALHCSAALPFAHPLPVWYGDEPYADGSLVSPIPVQAALDAGYDDLWIVLTRPRGYTMSAPRSPWMQRWYYRRFPALAEAILQRYRVYNEQLALAEALEAEGRARIVRPAAGMALSRVTRHRGRLRAAIAAGGEDGRNSLG